jgi:hypothetical protein
VVLEVYLELAAERLPELWPAVLLTLAGIAAVMRWTPREKQKR